MSFGQTHHWESPTAFSKIALQVSVLPQKRATSTVLLVNTGEHFSEKVSSTWLRWCVCKIWLFAGLSAAKNIDIRITVNRGAMITPYKMLCGCSQRHQWSNGEYQFTVQVWVRYTTIQSAVVANLWLIFIETIISGRHHHWFPWMFLLHNESNWHTAMTEKWYLHN